jgi:hypothetical protein
MPRAVPSIKGSERVNVRVVPSCRRREFLRATAEVAPSRLTGLGGWDRRKPSPSRSRPIAQSELQGLELAHLRA